MSRGALRVAPGVALAVLGLARPSWGDELPLPAAPPGDDAPIPAPALPPEPADTAAPAAPAPPRALPMDLPAPPGAGAWRITAGTLRWDPAARTLHATGGVVVTTPDRVVAAPEMTIHVDGGRVESAGPVVVADGTQVARCSSVVLFPARGTGSLHDVELAVHAPMDAATRDAVARLGMRPPSPATAKLTGRRVTLLSPGKLRVEEAWMTTCDCREGPAPIAVRARSATVVQEESAWLWLPTVEVAGVPVLVLPFWMVPLGGRQSGLLFPQVRLQDGLWVQQPLFVEVGRSADVTVAPGMVTQRGPRLALEGRAAPAQDTYLEAQLTWQRDAKHLWAHRDPHRAVGRSGRLPAPVEDAVGLQSTRTPRGERLYPDRFAGRLLARSRTGPAALAADVNLASDRYVPGDFGVSLGDRVAPYLRSAAAAQLRAPHLSASLGVASFQDLQQPDVLFAGRASARLVHRVPSLQLRVLEVPVLPALPRVGSLLAARALLSLDHAAPLGVGATREDFHRAGWVSAGTRLALQPELVAPLRLGRFGMARAAAGLRQAVFLADNGTVSDVTRAWVRTRAETELTGTLRLPSGGRIRHRVQPWVAYDGTWWTRASGAVTPWLDAWDRMGRYHAVGAGAANRWTFPSLAGSEPVLHADALGAVDLSNAVRSEVRLRGAAAWRSTQASARVAWEPGRREVTFMQAGLHVGEAASPQVHAGYTRVSARAPALVLAGEDDLLGGLRVPAPVTPGASDRLDVSVVLPVGDARLDWGVEAAFPGLELRPGARAADVRPTLLTHGGGVTYVSPCRCWSGGVRARFWPGADGRIRTIPDVALQLSFTGPDGELALFR
ncbi:MAG: LPS-assembly protein LptD [Deltaproteobacteria bacterium]|nr:LPS-assembly protein LptD [Deltaproteobacteria bacterium]